MPIGMLVRICSFKKSFGLQLMYTVEHKIEQLSFLPSTGRNFAENATQSKVLSNVQL